MKTRKIVVGAAMVVVGLPLLAILTILAPVFALNRTNGAIVSSGERREFLLHVPASYDRTRPTPLVISLHAAMNWPAFQRNLTHWNDVADEDGFIVVYPAGSGSGPRTWFMRGSRTPAQMPDVRFISDLIDTLEANYNIDPARIYANGMSNGGGMTFALSCTLSGRIAAFGAAAAAQSLPWSWCADSTPAPMIAFHGTADPVVPFHGAPPGWLNPAPFPDVSAWVASWAKRNRCAPSPIESTPAEEVTRLEFPDCAGGASVVLYEVLGGGHQWPGGKPMPEWLVGRMSNSVDATRLMWEFFREHPLAMR